MPRLREELRVVAGILRMQRLRRQNRGSASQKEGSGPSSGRATKTGLSRLGLVLMPLGLVIFTAFYYNLIGGIATALGPDMVVSASAIIAAATFAVYVVSSLGLANSNLAKLDTEVEWLMTLPVSPTTVYLTKVVESVIFRYSWLYFSPCYIAALLRMGYGVEAVPGGLALAFVAGCAAGVFGFALELVLRRLVAPIRLHMIQSIASVVGNASMLAVLYSSSWLGSAAAKWSDTIRPIGAFAAYLPTGSGLRVFGPGPFALRAWYAALSVADLVGTLVIGAGIISWASSRGLEAAQSGRSGSRGSSSHAERGFSSIAGKDLKMLARDKRLAAQILLSMLGALPLSLNFFRGTDFSLIERRGVLVLGVGVWVLAVSAPKVIFFEGEGLWLLYTLPLSLRRIFADKLKVWSGIAICLSMAVFSFILALRRTIDGSDATTLVFVAVGLPAYAFLSSAIGVTFYDPFATNENERIRRSAQFLPFLLAPLLTGGLYLPGVWSKIGCLGIFVVLSYAWWDKAGTYAEYLLDPVAKPPATLYLADGLLAVTIYFLIQQEITALLVFHGVPQILGMIVGMSLGGIVTLTAVWDVLRHEGAKLGDYVRVTNGLSFWRLLRPAIPAAAASIAIAAVYLVAARHFVSPEDLVSSAGFDPWIAALAVGAAPVVEETLFRGLVLNGFLRSSPTRFSVVASSALFALVHPGVSAFPVFCLAIAASLAYLRTRALLTPILVHATYNAAVLAMNVYLATR